MQTIFLGGLRCHSADSPLLLQAVAGIDTTLEDCRAGCQPQSGVYYIRAMYIAVLPVCNLLQGFVMLRFPISGERLRKLEERQAQAFQPLSSSATADGKPPETNTAANPLSK